MKGTSCPYRLILRRIANWLNPKPKKPVVIPLRLSPFAFDPEYGRKTSPDRFWLVCLDAHALPDPPRSAPSRQRFARDPAHTYNCTEVDMCVLPTDYKLTPKRVPWGWLVTPWYVELIWFHRGQLHGGSANIRRGTLEALRRYLRTFLSPH